MSPALYGSGESGNGILSLDPRTKLLIFFSSMELSTFCYNGQPFMMYCTVVCVLLALCGEVWFAVKCFLLIAVMEYVRYVMLSSGTGAPAVAGIILGIAMLFRYGIPPFLALALLIKTTRISKLIAALSAMRLPVFVIIPIAVLLRFIPTVREEWSGIRKAMAFRGVSLEPGAILRAPGKTVEYMLIPLLFSCISVMEELAAASLARGLDAERKRTSYEAVKMTLPDYIVMLLFVGMAIYAATGVGW